MVAEITIGGLSLLGLLTLFHTCDRAYDVFIRSAKNLGKDAHRLSIHLSVERRKLRLWGRYLGISHTQQCRLLRNESLDTQRLVVQLLDAIKTILDDIDIIMDRYGVRIIASVAGSDTIVTSESANTGIGGLESLNLDDMRSSEPLRLARLKRETTERSIVAATSRFEKLRWALNDNKKLEKLVLELRGFNDQLWVALPANKWLALARGLPSVVLPVMEEQEMIVEVGGSARGSERTGVLAACAELRNAAIEGQRNSGNVEFGRELLVAAGCVGEVMELDTGDPKITVEAKRQSAIVEMGDGTKRHVVIEWRYVDRALKYDEAEELRSRIRLLAVLLNSRRSVEFGLLKCIGFYKDTSTPVIERYGLMFETPLMTAAPSIPSTLDLSSSRPRSLYEFISLSKAMPLLGDRFSIAKSLCNTVLQLHASSWLHKAIRSSNIVFFPKSPSLPNTSDSPHNELVNLDISNPYLLGFDYSRPDKATADSLDTPSNRTFNDYRHPALWTTPTTARTSASKIRYRKEFDIYSLGVVLLEVGNWRLVRDQPDHFRHHRDPQIWKTQLLKCVDQLGYRCGAVYRDVVRNCLTGTFLEEVAWSDVLSSEKEDGEEPAVSEGSFLFDVVYKLGNCTA